MLHFSLTALALWLLLGLSGNTSADNKIRVGIHDFPPFSYVDQQGQPKGLVLDMLGRLMKHNQRAWEVNSRQLDSLLPDLFNGNTDLAMIIQHPILARKATYGSIPIGRVVMKSYRLANREPISHLEGFAGTRLIVLRGFGYGGAIEYFLDPDSGVSLVVAPDHLRAFEMLSREEGDYLLNYLGPANEVLRTLSNTQIVSETIKTEDIYFVVSPRIADPQSLLFELESGLKAIDHRLIMAPDIPAPQTGGCAVEGPANNATRETIE